MNSKQSDAFVFFGATGDLAHKKIFPALQAMIQRDGLDIPIIGVAKAGWNLDQLKARAKDSLQNYAKLDDAAFAKMCELLRYVDGDYSDAATFAALRKELGDAKAPLHYLAIPPSMFETVAKGLADSGCAKNARVVTEKPFGRNLASAKELNETLLRYFPNESIFRIDHFLGKEPVQNLIFFRFANRLIEASWGEHFIESVQITMAEKFGVQGRGKFYEETGAIRDVIQNHLLQVISCIAMEPPTHKGHASLRDARSNALKSVRALTVADVVRGQFDGYKDEPGVASDSQRETYAAIRFYIDNKRWKGVPFYVRAGKCLPVTATEILITYKRRPQPALDEPIPKQANYLRFQLSPNITISLGASAKLPGEALVGELLELTALDQHPDEKDAYERLLTDALHGDPMLFAREDSVEEAWRIVEPILDYAVPLHIYEANSWGPKEADQLLANGEVWRDPLADSNVNPNIGT